MHHPSTTSTRNDLNPEQNDDDDEPLSAAPGTNQADGQMDEHED